MKTRKTRVLILASPNGTLSIVSADNFYKRIDDYREKWQVLFHLKAVDPFRYKNSAYDYAVHAYGL